MSGTRDVVTQMLAQGRSQADIAKALGLAKSTVAHHARRTVPAEAKFRRRYDWAEVQRYYDDGHSITDCQRHFGFARKTATDACRRGDLVTRPQAMAIEKLLVVGRPTRRWHLRLRLLSAGLKENRCEACGLTEWLGRPLVMQLHHRNGDGLDNRLENLALLCPNCHSQTDTWGGRNRERPKSSRSPFGGRTATGTGLKAR